MIKYNSYSSLCSTCISPLCAVFYIALLDFKKPDPGCIFFYKCVTKADFFTTFLPE